MEFLEFVVTGLASIGCWELIKWLYDRRRMPYRWECSKANCHFSASSTDKAGIDLIKSNHTH